MAFSLLHIKLRDLYKNLGQVDMQAQSHYLSQANLTNLNHLSLIQGVFFITTGLWPMISMRTFETVTGPKVDDWLVKTVGLLIAVSGVELVRSGLRSNTPKKAAVLGVGDSLTLGAISLIYSLKGRISKVYLLDTLIEFSFAALWSFNLKRRLHEEK